MPDPTPQTPAPQPPKDATPPAQPVAPQPQTPAPAPKPTPPPVQTPTPAPTPPAPQPPQPSKQDAPWLAPTKSEPPKPAPPPTGQINVAPKPAPPLPKPVSPPPAAPAAMTPSAAPKQDELQPREPSKIRGWITAVLVFILFLILGGLAFLLVWPKLKAQMTPTAPQAPAVSTPTTPAPPTPSVEGIVTPTTTPAVGTTTSTTGTEPVVPFQDETGTVKRLGDTVEFFEKDEFTFRDPKNPNRSYLVGVVEFTDSRCPKGTVCVWAGELGVKLRVKDVATGKTEEVYLGTVRAKTAEALGVRFTLIEIDDGKGGTYAKITVE